MKIAKIRINNLASFIDFANDQEFKKNNLIFGTNGSGKSTLASLLLLIDDFKRKKRPDSEERLKAFFRSRLSKECRQDEILVEVTFEKGTETIQFDNRNNTIRCSESAWYPIRVFNEDYTERTMGESIQVDLSTGITIGEANIELEEAREARQSLIDERESCVQKVQEIVEAAVERFKEVTSSSASVQGVICIETALANECVSVQNSSLIEQRRKLGYGKPPRGVGRLDPEQVKLRLDLTAADGKSQETVAPPEISDDAASLLKDYTEFFSRGVEIYSSEGREACPFCRRDWPGAEAVIEQYSGFLTSSYTLKRNEIAALKTSLAEYKKQVTAQIAIVERTHKEALEEATSYQVDMTVWKPLLYDQAKHDEVCRLLDQKYAHMEEAISIAGALRALEESHVACVRGNDELISKIQEEIEATRSRRIALNKQLMDHFAREAWAGCSDQRKSIATIDRKLSELSARIEQLDSESPPKDTIRAVFNALIAFMGLGEYFLDENRRLSIRINRDYDISHEGRRISSAQRKCLSLCYFFAEVVSEVRSVQGLKQFILVFDDPVDSADYVFFYSIATVIEKAEAVLAGILGGKRLRFGQFFVLTHNSLMYDRLSAKWVDMRRSLRKQGSVSVLTAAERSINNYAEYIGEICRYYKSPGAQKRQMIYVGNLIRRVLEILSSFDSLGGSDLQTFLDGMGKPKLGLIANHLSHESFSRVLNPLSSPEELQDACGELLTLIKENHRLQYETIAARHELPAGL